MDKQKPRYVRHNLCFNITKYKQRQADRYLCLCGKKQAEVIAALIDKMLRENGITDLSLLTGKEAKELALKTTDAPDPVDRLSNLMESFLSKMESRQEEVQKTSSNPYVDTGVNRAEEQNDDVRDEKVAKYRHEEPEINGLIDMDDIDDYDEDEQGEIKVNPELENSLNMFM